MELDITSFERRVLELLKWTLMLDGYKRNVTREELTLLYQDRFCSNTKIKSLSFHVSELQHKGLLEVSWDKSNSCNPEFVWVRLK